MQAHSLRRTLPLTLFAAALAAGAAEAQYRRAFVTSVSGPGNFATWTDATPGATGLDAADSICQARAAAAGHPEPAAFRAWLSDTLDDAWCRVQGSTGRRDTGCDGSALPGAGPWARTGDDVPWAADLDALTGATGPLVPLDRDEFGNPIPVETVLWTATDELGRGIDPFTGNFCADWTSASAQQLTAAGTSDATRPAWTVEYVTSCDALRPLICLETGAATAQPPVAEIVPAALAFVTEARGSGDFGSWPQAGGASGVAAADAICRAEAAAAKLPHPQSFVALVSTAAQPVRDRIPTGLAWTRLDGVGVAGGRADLFDGSLRAPISLTSTGRYLPDSPEGEDAVWTGTAADGSGISGLDCLGWTSASVDEMALSGEPQTAAASWTDGHPTYCLAELPIRCLSTVPLLMFENFENGTLHRWTVVAD